MIESHAVSVLCVAFLQLPALVLFAMYENHGQGAAVLPFNECTVLHIIMPTNYSSKLSDCGSLSNSRLGCIVAILPQ
jgi:hypothetical protein